MTKGKTNSGFEYNIPKENLDNYELLEILADAEENPLLFPRAFKMFLGPEQMKKLKEHVRNENGVVAGKKMMDELIEIMESNNEVKNS